MANQELSVWWFQRGNFILQYLDGHKIRYLSIASVLENCNENVLGKMNELGIPPACYREETKQLFKILNKKYGNPNEMVIEDPKVTSWEFIDDSFKVAVTDDGKVDLFDPKDISSCDDLILIKQLSEIPIINNSGSKFAERLQSAVNSQVELWTQSESDEEIPNGSLGFSSKEETNFDP